MSKKLKDIVVDGNQEELKKGLNKIVNKSKYIKCWIKKNIERNSRSKILLNLLTSTSDYLEVMLSSLDSHISVLALSTRSIYELNVRLRSVIENNDEMQKWESEAATDEIQMFEGILLIDINNKESMRNQCILRERIQRAKQSVDEQGLPSIQQPASTGNLAKTVGLEEEHKAFFKFYSKLVHPSSYLVNNYNDADSNEHQKILQVQAQKYALDSIHRICVELAVPYDISKPYGTTSQGIALG